MSKRIHITVSGHGIEFAPKPDVAAFLERIEAMLEDPRATKDEMVLLAYSKENPMLDPSIFATRGAVTTAVMADPAYRVLTDLLYRKALPPETIERTAARYTMSVTEAADMLDMPDEEIRRAIEAQQLASWTKNGTPYLDRRNVHLYGCRSRS